MREYDLVVVGTGPAGQRAAIAATKLNERVAVVERSLQVGGGCIHQGTIPSKTLREAVAYLSGVRQREIYGAAYRVKERITLQYLAFRMRRVVEKEVNVVRDQLLRNYVEVVPGRASFLDPHWLLVTTDEGTRTLGADRIILAVGSRPSRPPGIEFDDRRIIDSDGLLNLPEVPRTMTFVGAGIIGVEYATIFRVLGVRVTLVDARRRPLEFVDDEIEDALYYHMRDEGITLRLGERVAQVRPAEEGRVLVSLESGKTLVTDSLMFSAGRLGATDGLTSSGRGSRPTREAGSRSTSAIAPAPGTCTRSGT